MTSPARVKEGAYGDRVCVLHGDTFCYDLVALNGVDVRGISAEMNEVEESKSSSWKLEMSDVNEVDTKLLLERVSTF